MYFVVKCLVSGVLVAMISEMARRSPLAGAIFASLPVTSILAFIWLYQDTHSSHQVAELSAQIALVVLPSLAFFVILSVLLTKSHLNFYVALIISCLGMAVVYAVYVWLLTQFKLRL